MRQLISAFLASALLVTGTLSLAVFAMPDLITLGLFMLILPGLILGYSPTVFLYVLVFSIPWFLLQYRGVLPGVLGGAASVYFFGVGLPMMLNVQTNARLAHARSLDLAPRVPIPASPQDRKSVV